MANKKRMWIGIILIILVLIKLVSAYVALPISWDIIIGLVIALFVGIWGIKNRNFIVTFVVLALIVAGGNSTLKIIPLDSSSLFWMMIILGGGLHLIFAEEKGTTVDKNKVADVVMSSSNQYLYQDNNNAGIDVVMGNLNLYIDQSIERPVKLDLDVVMGNATIYVPANWNVSSQTTNFMGATKVMGAMANMNAKPDVVITGSTVMGSIIIKRI